MCWFGSVGIAEEGSDKKSTSLNTYSNQEYISPIFVRPNSDNWWRIEQIRKSISISKWRHWRMLSSYSQTRLFCCCCFLLSGPERCTFLFCFCFSLHVSESSQADLKFFWRGELYMFPILSSGLACCTKLFRKLLKAVMVYRICSALCQQFVLMTLCWWETQKRSVQNVNSSLVLFKTLNKSLGLFTRSSLCWSNLTKLLTWGLK